MGRRWILVGIVFLLLPWLLVGCGVAQEMYDAVAADLSKAQQALQSVQAELEAAQSQVLELTSSLEETQAKNSELTSSLEKTKSELQAASAELTARVQKSQAELQAAQDKVSELTSSLEKVENELETIKSEYEAFKSEVESLLVLSKDQHVALQTASRDAKSAFFSRDYGAFRSADRTVKGILADLNDVTADRLRSLWNDAYDVEQVMSRLPGPGYTIETWNYLWRSDPVCSFDFDKLNNETLLAVKKLLSVY